MQSLKTFFKRWLWNNLFAAAASFLTVSYLFKNDRSSSVAKKTLQFLYLLFQSAFDTVFQIYLVYSQLRDADNALLQLQKTEYSAFTLTNVYFCNGDPIHLKDNREMFSSWDIRHFRRGGKILHWKRGSCRSEESGYSYNFFRFRNAIEETMTPNQSLKAFHFVLA